ncbi:hypothetical protein FNV43_RR09874 [Rhamnella rubrinervis]|uniref:Protein kinase domain-containing protein n=1 Tax=Rhamnella rubrinervis TaxID=2594499 RepID=A0A8K0HAR4_9ROSA|nr:hypothetical protein FNV43_RR09874 [Rhamnella rubrinervis]
MVSAPPKVLTWFLLLLPLMTCCSNIAQTHGKALIKIRKDGGSKKKDHNSTLVLVVSVLLSGSVFMNVLLAVASFFVAFHLNPKVNKLVQPNPVASGINLLVFTYEELNKATDEFKEHLGSGAFAAVYKGLLPFDKDNGKSIAVKKLHNLVSEGDQEFKAEQWVPSKFAFGPSSSRPNWYKRIAIAQGTARGLFYLHEECSTQIIHCDVKSQNILLDDSFTPRISDFGLAKLLKKDQTRTTTGIRGTKGYVAPEWFRNMPVTNKVDVYSYGIVLLEIICCRRNFEAEAEDENQMILSDWAYDCYHYGRVDVLVKNDDEAMNDMKMVKKHLMVAIWCIQEDPSFRPTMKKLPRCLKEPFQSQFRLIHLHLLVPSKIVYLLQCMLDFLAYYV